MQQTQPIRTRNTLKQHNRKRFESHNNGFKNPKTRHQKSNGETRTMLVQISDKEQSRIEPARQYYIEQGHEVEVTNLEVGDYVFDNKVCFEFKALPDFVSSIQSGRVFNQAISMAENYDYHFVLIQGNEAERSKTLAISKHYRQVTIYQYIGAISSLNRYTSVIECYSPYIQEAFYRMQSQAQKCLQNRPIVKKFPKKDKNPAFNYLCYCIYGINAKKAQLIVDSLQPHSLTDLLVVSAKDLKNIEGIGEKTAKKIYEAIHGSQD